MSEHSTERGSGPGVGREGREARPSGRVEIRLASPDPVREHFDPLATPEIESIRQVDLHGDQVEHAHVELEATLRAGGHSLPVTDREPLDVEVAPDTRCRVWMEASPGLDPETGRTLITAAEVTFSPGIRLTSVWPVLSRLPAMFEDYDLERLREQVERLAGSETADSARSFVQSLWNQWEAPLARWAAQTPGVGERVAEAQQRARGAARRIWGELRGGAALLRHEMRARADQLPVVTLERAMATPVRRRGVWRLALRFSGEVTVPGGLSHRFREVLLPTTILPAPSAALAGLLSSSPLATARLRRDRLEFRDLGVALADVVTGFEGRVDARIRPPEVRVSAPTPNLGTVTTSVRLPEPVLIRGRISGEISTEEARVAWSDVEVGSVEGQLHLAGSGGVRWREMGASAPESREPVSVEGVAGEGVAVEGVSVEGVSVEGVAVEGVAGEGVAGEPVVGDGEETWRRSRRILPALMSAALDARFPTDEMQAFGELRVEPGSMLASLEMHTTLSHPLTEDSSGVTLALDRFEVSGRLRGEDPDDPEASWLADLDIDYGAALRLPEGSVLDDGLIRLGPEVAEGQLEGRLARGSDGGVRVEAWGRGNLSADGGVDVPDFPELNIDRGVMTLRLSGGLDFRLVLETGPLAGRSWNVALAGSEASVRLDEAHATLGDRRLSLPSGSKLSGRLVEASLDSRGLGAARVAVGWDLGGESPVLSGRDRQVEIFVEELRAREMELRVSPEGGVGITGEAGGLYDAHFFNALIRPGAEVERWLDILDNDEAMDTVLGALGIFSLEAARGLAWLRDQAKRARSILDELEIRQAGDFLPSLTMARVASRMLAGDDGLTEELHGIVKQVTDGNGLDVRATKRLLDAHLGEHELDYELDRGLRIAARLLAPTDPIPPRAVESQQPLVERSGYASSFAAYPGAARIYDMLAPGVEVTPADSTAVARVASYLTIEQVEYALAADGGRLRPPDRQWLVAVREVKSRVQDISEQYGGIAFLPQAWAISFFLGAALRARPPFEPEPEPDLAPRGGVEAATESAGGRTLLGRGLLGPREVAVLLQSGLASLWQGGPVQVNLRLLLDYVDAQPATFCREVLVEMAGRSARALTGVLYALLHLRQGRMARPLDVDAWLSTRLALEVPDLQDYMAGGRWARESHYEALSRTAELILAEAEPYLALLEHLRVVRIPVAVPVEEISEHRSLAERARAAIAEADRLGAECRFRGREPARRRKAVAAYAAAFEACRVLRSEEPAAFTRPWFKAFWGRNHEALVVWSVVRNVQEDVDEVRRWLSIRTGAPVPDAEQPLVDAVIDALYYFSEDRDALKADPLVRLLIDPPPGRYDFTVVSAMGVITEGAQGTELKDAYARLERTRGVRTLRADTQTARSLDFNAARIEDAVRLATTPWGYIGYSQGCANGLRAESRLLGGTPEQQALARRLVCRNLLFSATNGSAHGTCGDWKFLRAMIDLDRFLKHYQAVFSSRAIDLALRNIGLVLDSRPFVHSMGGVDSLSHAGVSALARDGQWRGDVPTSILRGIVEPETLPESLEMLSNVLTKQIESSDHDTQVTITEAQGYPVWTRSPMAEVLERCDMGCLVQRTHHWSPLKYATEFVTTDRDRAHAIYDFPKDRHVVPWIEVNARFGVIERADE